MGIDAATGNPQAAVNGHYGIDFGDMPRSFFQHPASIFAPNVAAAPYPGHVSAGPVEQSYDDLLKKAGGVDILSLNAVSLDT